MVRRDEKLLWLKGQVPKNSCWVKSPPETPQFLTTSRYKELTVLATTAGPKRIRFQEG